MKTIIVLLLSIIIPFTAATQSIPNIPTHVCKQYGGRHFTPGTGTWSDNFWYGSTIIAPSSANTNYNKFRSAYADLRMFYRAKIASVYLMQALCVSSAESSYGWCIIPCTVSLRPDCSQDCWDNLQLDLDECLEKQDKEIFYARQECDRILKALLDEFGSCS